MREGIRDKVVLDTSWGSQNVSNLAAWWPWCGVVGWGGTGRGVAGWDGAGRDRSWTGYGGRQDGRELDGTDGLGDETGRDGVGRGRDTWGAFGVWSGGGRGRGGVRKVNQNLGTRRVSAP